jgi:hypothetical protein
MRGSRLICRKDGFRPVDWLLWGAIWRVKGASRAKIDKVAVHPGVNNL